MKLPLRQNNKGFTLIELLVVISIIGLLASVIMVSLGDARTEARNSARNSMALEYINAFELYRSDNIGYPNFRNTSSVDEDADLNDTYYCLGEPQGTNVCQHNMNSLNDLNTAISEFISGPPRDESNLDISGTDYSGITYACNDGGPYNDSDEPCTSFILIWYLESDDEDDCPRGSFGQDFIPGNSIRCTYPE